MGSGDRSTGAVRPRELDATIRASGNLGLTTAQLVRSTGAARDHVQRALDELQARDRVVRVGHGLWVSRSMLEDPSKGSGFSSPAGYLEEFACRHRVPVADWSGEIQFRSNTDEPVHRWWPYVQGFSAEFVRRTLERHRMGPGATVLDPFAGSGTVPTEARRAGAASIGIELMPISAFVAEAKQRWETDPRTLRRRAAAILRSAPRRRPGELPFLKETRRQFDPGPLDALLRLRGAVEEATRSGGADLLRLAFARILVDSSRMRRSPCLGYGPKARVPPQGPYVLFQAAIDRMAADLESLQTARVGWGPASEIRREDSRSTSLADASIDLAITSPPYVNGMDYVMNYKLEMAWLGFVGSYADLRDLKERMVACDNLPRSSAQRGWRDDGLRRVPWMDGILTAIARNLRSKSSYRRDDMDAIVASYFADLRPVISRIFSSLKPGGGFVVVNGDSFLAGVYVPGDLIFAELAVEAGFEVEAFEIARMRRSGQRRDLRLRETVVTLRRPDAGASS